MEDEQNRAFDVEMQASRPKENDGPLGLRTRYYQSLMDQRALEKGHRYGDLRETFIIFICAFIFWSMWRSGNLWGHSRRMLPLKWRG